LVPDPMDLPGMTYAEDCDESLCSYPLVWFGGRESFLYGPDPRE